MVRIESNKKITITIERAGENKNDNLVSERINHYEKKILDNTCTSDEWLRYMELKIEEIKKL